MYPPVNNQQQQPAPQQPEPVGYGPPEEGRPPPPHREADPILSRGPGFRPTTQAQEPAYHEQIDRRLPPQRHTHPEWLVSMAKTYGFRDEVITQRNSDELGRMIEGAQQREAAYGETVERLMGGPRQPQQQPAPPPAPKVYDFGTIKDSDGRDQRVTLDEQNPQVDPYIARILLQQQQTIEELRQQNQTIARTTQVMRAQDVLDEAFEFLAPHYGRLFGQGTSGELQQAGQVPTLQRRVQLLVAVGVNPDNPPPARVVARMVSEYIEQLRGDVAQQPVRGDYPQQPNPYTAPDGSRPPAATQRQPQTPPQPDRPLPLVGAGNVYPAVYPGQQPRAADGRYQSPRQVQQQQWNDGGLAAPTHRTAGGPAAGRAKAEANVSRMLQEFAEQEAEAGNTMYEQNGRFIP